MAIKQITEEQFEKIRLLLSVYQDGSGRNAKDSTLINWEDFENIIEVVFDGKRLKSKSVFDIIINDIGISCKITNTLQQSQKKNTVLIEHSRINAEFFNITKQKLITREEIFKNSQLCGDILIDLINSKHNLNAQYHNIDLLKSFFLVLVYDITIKQFKIFQFPIKMPKKEIIRWSFNSTNKHLRGLINDQLVAQWFHDGGGQFKYYPIIDKAIYQSYIFCLEPLKIRNNNSLMDKVKNYFGNTWLKL